MKRMAIFVEGMSDMLFIDSLIQAVADVSKVKIELRQILGGTNVPKRILKIGKSADSASHEAMILIYDCKGDKAVKSRMLEEYASLIKSGYSKILCVRDVYPDFTHADISSLVRGLPVYVPTKPVKVDFILSIMEVEAYFIAEHTHFARFDSRLTLVDIISAVGFNPQHDDLQLRQNPAKDLHDCYATCGISYSKSNVKKTIDAIDYSHVYIGLVDRFPQLKILCELLEEFLSLPQLPKD